VTPAYQPCNRWRRLFFGVCLLCLLGASAGFPAEAARTYFNLPADTAERALKRLAEQSGREVLFPADAVEGVRTRVVKGEMTPDAALAAMLAGTVLVGVQDDKTGSLTVRRENSVADAEKKVGRAARVKTGDRPLNQTLPTSAANHPLPP
jgi:hypothetical protein